MEDKIKIRGQLKTYLAWPLLLSLFLICGNVAVALVSPWGAAVMFPFTVCYIAVAVWIYLYRRKRMLGGLVEFSADYAWIQKQLLAEMALPYGLADEDGRLLWTNPGIPGYAGRQKRSIKRIFWPYFRR